MQLFLDANAHVPMGQVAIDAFVRVNNSLAGQGHAMAKSSLGRLAAQEIEKAREIIAECIGAQANQIIFTSSGTQACEWGLDLLANQKYNKVYTSTIEHSSVAEKSRTLFGNNDLFCTKEAIVSCGFSPSEDNVAFVCIHVQNEIGTIQPIEQIKVPFFCDLSQSIGKIPVNVSKYKNLKFGAFGAHKFGGSSSVGVLYIQNPKDWKAFGMGSRYYFDRAGTPDVGMIAASAVALQQAKKTIPVRYEKAIQFKNILESFLQSIEVPVIGYNANRIPHCTFIQVKHQMAPYVMAQLEAEGIFVGLGSACASLHSGTNPIMTALGYGGRASDYLRISQYGNYSEREARVLIQALDKYLPKKTDI